MAKSKIAKRTKKASSYNLFMKEEMAKYRESTPGSNHKDAFKIVAAKWAISPKNPKNKKSD